MCVRETLISTSFALLCLFCETTHQSIASILSFSRYNTMVHILAHTVKSVELFPLAVWVHVFTAWNRMASTVIQPCTQGFFLNFNWQCYNMHETWGFPPLVGKNGSCSCYEFRRMAVLKSSLFYQITESIFYEKKYVLSLNFPTRYI